MAAVSSCEQGAELEHCQRKSSSRTKARTFYAYYRKSVLAGSKAVPFGSGDSDYVPSRGISAQTYTTSTYS